MDAATLKTLLLDSIMKNIGCYYTFTEEGESLLEEAASEADDKRRAALIINALNVTKNGQVENTYDPEDYIDDLVEDLYNEDDPEESTLSKPELNKIEAHQVIDVEFENHLPVSITFAKLDCPITSIAFMGVIKKVFFGDQKEWMYAPELYREQHSCLDDLGIRIPESVFQYDFFYGRILGYCDIFEWLLSKNDLGADGSLSPLVDRLRNPNKNKEKQTGIQSVFDLDINGEENKGLLEYIFKYGWGEVAGRNIVLFTADRAQGGLFFNEGENRFMGFYWSEGGRTDIYRSLSDYVNSMLSSEIECFLLLAAYRAFVDMNKVTINDGIEYKIASDAKINSLTHFIGHGIKFNTEEEDSGNYFAGWLDKSIPWDV